MNPRILALALVISTAAAASGAASAYPGERLAPQARVSMPRARATALHTVHGRITSSELEREAGGSGLRYTFDIATPAGTREVGVDAKTGAVLENSTDAPAAGAAAHPDGERADGKD